MISEQKKEKKKEKESQPPATLVDVACCAIVEVDVRGGEKVSPPTCRCVFLHEPEHHSFISELSPSAVVPFTSMP